MRSNFILEVQGDALNLHIAASLERHKISVCSSHIITINLKLNNKIDLPAR